MESMLRDDFRTLLEEMAAALDISEKNYADAKEHYEAVGKWLQASNSFLLEYKPAVYTQGSFRLGTVIKPLNDADEYDIDFVCELATLRKDNITQVELKKMVGDRLKEHGTYKPMLQEGDRCWKLGYSGSPSFHMDILPSVPDGLSPRFKEDAKLNLHAVFEPIRESNRITAQPIWIKR